MSFPSLFAFCALLTVTPFAAAAQTSGDYALNFDKSQTITRSDRLLRAVTLQSADGPQTISVGTRLVYNDLTAQTFTAVPGDEVQVRFSYQTPGSPWMHGYVYLDSNNDGRFSPDELLAYSYAAGKNSLGQAASPSDALQPPAFRLPEGLTVGKYRLRVKIDWDNTDSAGALGEDGTVMGKNGIVPNGGAVADFTLDLHATAYPRVSL
ncbi:MAG: GEVED domain-containing protein, partial [Alloprevotella sp.]